eukprot:SM000228S07378  [mRNA]  locus=s228:146349:147253:+ [translate_table: standard]
MSMASRLVGRSRSTARGGHRPDGGIGDLPLPPGRGSHGPASPAEPPPPPPPLPPPPPPAPDADEEGELEKMMAKFGMPVGFNTTKGKPVADGNHSAVKLTTKRQPRQYMNRRGGFNRPLPAEVNR